VAVRVRVVAARDIARVPSEVTAGHAMSPGVASSYEPDQPALPRCVSIRPAPHRLPLAHPAMESVLRMVHAPLFRGSLCRQNLQSARENEIGRVQ